MTVAGARGVRRRIDGQPAQEPADDRGGRRPTAADRGSGRASTHSSSSPAARCPRRSADGAAPVPEPQRRRLRRNVVTGWGQPEREAFVAAADRDHQRVGAVPDGPSGVSSPVCALRRDELGQRVEPVGAVVHQRGMARKVAGTSIIRWRRRAGRSATPGGSARAIRWPPGSTSAVTPRRSRATRTWKSAGNSRSSRPTSTWVGTSGQRSNVHGSVKAISASSRPFATTAGSSTSTGTSCRKVSTRSKSAG